MRSIFRRSRQFLAAGMLAVLVVGPAFSAAPKKDSGRGMPDLKLPVEGAVGCTWANIDTYLPVWDRQSGALVGIYFLKDLPKAGNPALPDFPALAALAGRMIRMPDWHQPQPPGEMRTLEERKVYQIERVALRDIDKDPGTPARQLFPLRMAMIAASFPYKAQLEEFAGKLHLSPRQVLQEQVKDPVTGRPAPACRFLGVKVQRRTLDSTGKPLPGMDWTDIDLGEAFRPWLVLTGMRFEPDKPRYAPISFPGLFMRPFRLFRENPDAGPEEMENGYPDVAGRLATINTTLAALAKKAPAEPTIPEHCLIRLIDLNVEPGKTYEYRIQVRMANPNFERADVADPLWARDRELTSKDWFVIPQKVIVPPEMRYYACDQKEVDEGECKKHLGPNPGQVPDKDRNTVLQMHRWLGAALIRSAGREPLMVGEWVVADRVRVFRGEYTDRTVRVELPVWSVRHNAFVLPVDRSGRRDRRLGVDVDFGHEDDRQTILVDFDGGPKSYGRALPRVDDASATEVLLMTPEGKLLGHDSAADSMDTERRRQREIAARRVEQVRNKAGNAVGAR